MLAGMRDGDAPRWMQAGVTRAAMFRVARNPDPGSQLPYLIWLPVDGGVVLKAREPWPRAARVFCSDERTPWNESAPMVDDCAVVLCRRRGAAIDLVLDRPQLARSQFVFTAYFGGNRPPISAESDQPFRMKAISHFGVSD